MTDLCMDNSHTYVILLSVSRGGAERAGHERNHSQTKEETRKHEILVRPLCEALRLAAAGIGRHGAGSFAPFEAGQGETQ